MTCIAYADDICLFASSKAALETMISDCIRGFEKAGLSTGLDKTFWTSTSCTPNETMSVSGHTLKWSEHITFVGAKVQMCRHSGLTMAHRIQAATSVFEKWSSILCDATLPLEQRVKCFRSSVLSSVQWQSGSWTLTKAQAAHLQSWGARLHARMMNIRQSEFEDMGQYWRRLHRAGHKCMADFNSSPLIAHLVQKHRMAGHFARLNGDEVVSKVLSCRDLSWWRSQQELWQQRGDKWGGVHSRRFNCWRWEQSLENDFGIVARPPHLQPHEVGWKRVAQDREAWKLHEPRL